MTASDAERRPHVVIIGGGFGGLYAAKALRDVDVDITVVDRRNHHLFQPLLYQVATAALNPSDIAAPIRSVLRDNPRLRVVLAEVTGIDVAARQVALADGAPLSYDYLIVAGGVTHSYFGHEAWAPFAPGLKSIEDALDIRRRILFAYEAAERAVDPEERRAWMTFLVVGAGPTGVELAGAMAEIAHHALVEDFRNIDSHDARVILVEGEARVLPSFDERLAPKAQRQLEKLGAEVRLGVRVTAIDALGVTVTPDERIAARTVVWAAGVKASPLGKMLGAPLDRAGRVLVNADLSIPGHPEVFVVGDLAAFQDRGHWVPGLAPAAIQGGRHAAANIRRAVEKQPPEVFEYFDKGSLATIGRAAAVGQIGKLRLSGFIAWLGWAFIHLIYVIGFRNRLLVFIEWAWSYVTFQRGARLITGPNPTAPPATLVKEPASADLPRQPPANLV